LVETVKGYAKHEQETLQKVIEARNRLMGGGGRAEQLEANDQLSGALRSLFALRRPTRTSRRTRDLTSSRSSWRGPKTRSPRRGSSTTAR